MTDTAMTEVVTESVDVKPWTNHATVIDDAASEGEVICGVPNDCIIFPSASNTVVVANDNANTQMPIVHYDFIEQDFFNIQVTEEEVVSESWGNGQVANEEVVQSVGDVKVAYNPSVDSDDVEIPLPLDQDAYTAMRPYPCDFCSRRFRKKANLMNHMVAHQTDRPHGCNLCGARYRRKCELINHMKIHAYAPGHVVSDDEDEDESAGNPPSPVQNDSSGGGNRGRRKKSLVPRKRKNFLNSYNSKRAADESGYKKKSLVNSAGKKKSVDNNSSSGVSTNATHSYVDEDVKLLQLSAAKFVETEYNQDDEQFDDQQQYQPPPAPAEPPRWPVVDASRPYVCQHCGVGFAREKALGSHARIHAGDSPFECNTCGEMFWDIGLLREHSKSKHSGRMHVKSEVNSDEYSHVCQVCGQNFASDADLLAHMETHARYQPHRCMLCGECFLDGASVAAHVRKRHAKNIPPNACTLCGKTCRDRRSLQKHTWVHSAERCFACQECGKRFHSRARLKRHMVSHRDKAVRCEECGEEFPDGRALINHRHSHKQDLTGRQFSCLECGKTFGSRSSQQIHARIHTGERPYGCRFCWKAFADGGTLRKHERIHTGEKPYACPVCPRAFNQRVVLREHIRSHHSGPEHRTNSNFSLIYACKVCAGTFSRSEELCAHLIKHSDENTAKHRMPRLGPRKYKRRRKLNPHELTMLSGGSERVDSGNKSGDDDDEDEDDESDDNDNSAKHKITKKRYRARGKSNTTENLENVVKTFKSVVENFNSIVSNSKSEPGKKKHKLKSKIDRKQSVNSPATVNIAGAGDNSNSKPGVSTKYMSGGFLRSTRPAGQARARPRTKNVTLSTLAALKAVSTKTNSNAAPDSTRVRPRTKNVNYHNVKMAKVQTAKFPVDDKPSKVNMGRPRSRKGAAGRSRRGTRKVPIQSRTKASSNNAPASSSASTAVATAPAVTSPDPEDGKDAAIKVEYTCEMCSETFTRRSELLVHVPIHI
ncbi:zinc finger protein 420 isoform X2 [Anabrus simplex]|uniref:zinc finger protein 420 isoform X2 n=1 Tax=Anabrus simplex TaxID=316456 RepID=UPI0034DD4505